MQLRADDNQDLEKQVRAALGEDVQLTRVGRKGNVSVLYRFGVDGVAKTMLPTMPPAFLANHARELDFYRRTKRFPFRDVRGNVLLMEYLSDGEMPDQVKGLSFDQMRRVMLAASKFHQEMIPWESMEKVCDVVLGLGRSFALPVLNQVTEEGVRKLGFCKGREHEAVKLMHSIMDDWESVVADLAGNSVVHGDFRGENVFLPSNESLDAVVFDWQLVCAGSVFVDLAYLLAGSLTVADCEKHEIALLEVYHGGPCDERFLAQYHRALRWPVVWAVFVCGGGLNHLDKSSDAWIYQETVTERFLQAALRHCSANM